MFRWQPLDFIGHAYLTCMITCGSFMFLFCLVFAMFCARLFICALWSPAGKGLTSWLSFVVSSVSLSLSHWYPGSGVVLDCIDSWSLQPYYFESVVMLGFCFSPFFQDKRYNRMPIWNPVENNFCKAQLSSNTRLLETGFQLNNRMIYKEVYY